MKLSIIIVNYRSWGHLQKALDSLQPGFPRDWEIVVVDNESEPNTFDEFRHKYPWVNFVACERNVGFGFGCNIGAKHATGSQLLFMNPDVVANSKNIRSLIRLKEQHPQIALLAPKQVNQLGRPQKVYDEFPDLHNQSKIVRGLLRLLWPSRFGKPPPGDSPIIYCDWVTGSFLLISRDDFDAMGGWSEDYWMYAEDADLCRRAHDFGKRVAYAPNIQVVHVHGGSSRINVAVKAMTKLEVIISKHAYAQNHFRGTRRTLMHLLIGFLRLPSLLLMSALDILTLRMFPGLRVRSRMLVGLLRYYSGVRRTGSWLSPRAIANQESASPVQPSP
ncbi:MAG: glycosyltransferase family 2 protein [Woeseiaceae bacterium]|nr:glycosyltransferase family 2 protein [Woeseiaceae bacterium]